MRDRKKILIVDDEVGFTRLLEAFLKERGYHVAVAQGGERALEMLKTSCPDLILLDLGLPDLAGDVTALRIRSENRNRIPIIAVTGHGDSLTQATARAVGFEDYVLKPFEPDDLIQRIERILRGSPA